MLQQGAKILQLLSDKVHGEPSSALPNLCAKLVVVCSHVCGGILGLWTGGVEGFEDFLWAVNKKMNPTIEIQEFQRELNDDFASNSLLITGFVTLSLDFFLLFCELITKEGWPPCWPASCAEQCEHV